MVDMKRGEPVAKVHPLKAGDPLPDGFMFCVVDEIVPPNAWLMHKDSHDVIKGEKFDYARIAEPGETFIPGKHYFMENKGAVYKRREIQDGWAIVEENGSAGVMNPGQLKKARFTPVTTE